MAEEYRIPYKCGRDDLEWEAVLTPHGPKFRFARFEHLDMVKESPVESEKLRIAKGWQEAKEAIKARPPIAPPPQTEIINRSTKQGLSEDNITSFGFQCPSCKNNTPLLCPVPSCRKFSCEGSPRDQAGRIQCTWCGAILVDHEILPGEPQPPRIEIDVTSMRPEARNRELQSGKD